jgi:hypothetical protein
MKRKSLLRLLLASNALSLGLAEYDELEFILNTVVPGGEEIEEALVLLDFFYSKKRVNDEDYQALTDLFKCAAASL